MKAYTAEELKNHAQETSHLKKGSKEKISNLDNALSFSQRKRDFCRKLADEAMLAREYAYMKWDKLDNDARRAEKKLAYTKIKCAILKLFLKMGS